MIRAVFMDLDGTIYRGDDLVEGALDTIDFLRSHGIKILFMTNNSEKTRGEVVSKLGVLGIGADLSEVLSSGYVAAQYLKENDIKNVYICGSDSFKKECMHIGVDVVSESCAKNLVIGMDSKFNYEKLSIAVRVAMSSDNVVACNLERTFPSKGGIIMPGCGAIASAVEFSSKHPIDLVTGKPSPIMFDVGLKMADVDRTDVILIGDSMESDIYMAQSCGCRYIHIDSVSCKNQKDVLNKLREEI